MAKFKTRVLSESALLCLALFSFVSNAHAFEFKARSWGHCEPYNSSNLCGSYINNEQIWVFSNSTQEDQEALVAEVFFLLDVAASVVGNSHCSETWKRQYCHSIFPPCTTVEGNEVFQKMCKSSCESLYDICGEGFISVEEQGYGAHVLKCDDNINQHPLTYMFPNFPPQWDGTPVYESEPSTSLTLPDNTVVEVPCKLVTDSALCPRKTCPKPYVERTRSINYGDGNDALCMAAGEDGFPCDMCTSSCLLPCELPIWRNGKTWDLTWLARVLPGALSLPFNLVIILSELKKYIEGRHPSKGSKSKPNFWVLLCAILGFLYACLDSLPSLVLKFELRCDGYDAVDDAINRDGHVFCQLGQYNVHLLQSLFATVSITLNELRKKLDAARRMVAYRQGRRNFLFSLFFSIAIPIILVIFHATQPLSDGIRNVRINGTKTLTDMAMGNLVRYAFVCGPRFESLNTEWALVLAPLVIIGLILTVLSFRLLAAVQRMAGFSGTEALRTGLFKRDKYTRKKTRLPVNKTTMKLARKMLNFALVIVTLVALNLTTVVPWLSKALEFSNSLESWLGCAATGFDLDNCGGDLTHCEVQNTMDNLELTEKRCGVFDEMAPNSTLMVLIHLSYSIPALAFGVLFGYMAFKSLVGQASRKIQDLTSTAVSAMSIAQLTEQQHYPNTIYDQQQPDQSQG